MGKIIEVTPVYVEKFPKEEDMEEGKLYISKKYGLSDHLCACGCRGQTVMDFKPIHKDGWELIENPDGTVSFTPSIGNFSGETPYHAHYFITNNKIIGC
jgi:hypothetical protein